MNILWLSWEVFVNLIENLLFCILLNKKLGYEQDKALRIWGGFLAITLIVSIFNHLNIDYRLVMILIMILDIFYALWSHSGDRGERIFWGSSSTVIAFIANSVILSLFSFTQNIDPNNVLAHTKIRFQLMCLYLLAILIMFSLLYFINSKRTIIPSPIQILLIALLTTGTIASGLLIKINFLLSEAPHITKLVVLVSGLFLIIMIAIMLIFEYMGVLNKRNLDLKLALQQEKLENSYNQHMIDVYEAFKSWKHDYKNHLLIIKSYAQQKQHDDLIKYIGDLDNQFSELTTCINTGNTAIDALVSNKIFVANSQNIPISTSIILPESLPFSTLDFCAILANLLDNAIESCQRLPDELRSQSYIDLKVEPKLGMLSIHIINRSNGIYKYDSNNLLSSKKESDHGLGLKRINSIIKSINGFCEIKPEDTSFTVYILIPLS